MKEDADLDLGQDILNNNDDFREYLLEYLNDGRLDNEQQCYFCQEIYQTALECYCHERYCSTGSTKRFTCQKCGLNFKYKQGLEYHEQRHVHPGGFLCHLCDARFTSATARLEHKSSQHPIFECQICLKISKSSADYVTHILNSHSASRSKKEEQSSQGTESQSSDLSVSIKNEPLVEIEFYDSHAQKVKEGKHLENDYDLGVKEEAVDAPDDSAEQPDSPLPDAVFDSDHSDRESAATDSAVKTKDFSCHICEKTYCYSGNLAKHLKDEHALQSDDEQWPEKVAGTKAKVFSCKFCNKCYRTRTVLERHLKLHGPDGKPRLHCKTCGGIFADVTAFEEHKKGHTFTCAICTKDFLAKGNLRFHMEKIHLDPKRKAFQYCAKCGAKFSSKARLKEHEAVNCGKRPAHQCQVCKKHFTFPHDVKEHMMLHTDSPYPPYHCPHCDKTFRNKKSRRMHIEKIHRSSNYSEKTHNCPICKRSFVGVTRTYIQHMLKDHGVEVKRPKRVHLCDYCRRKFPTEEDLQKHFKRTHLVDGKAKTKCNYCGEYFDNYDALIEHKWREHCDKYTCKLCGKFVKSENVLICHMNRKHTAEQSYTKNKFLCGKCGKCFSGRTAYRDHEQSDCGRLPQYQCDICKKFLRTMGSLKTHKTSHRIVKPFACSYCGKTYTTLAHLREHETTHTGAKPFQCPYCPKAFGQNKTLSTHLTVHTGIKRYMCSACGQRFACLSNLKVHRQSKANNCHLVPINTKPVGPTVDFVIAKSELDEQ